MKGNILFVRVFPECHGYTIRLVLECRNRLSNSFKLVFYDEIAKEYVANIAFTNRHYIDVTLCAEHAVERMWDYTVQETPSGLVVYHFGLVEKGKPVRPLSKHTNHKTSDWAEWIALCFYNKTQWIQIKVEQSKVEELPPHPTCAT